MEKPGGHFSTTNSAANPGKKNTNN